MGGISPAKAAGKVTVRPWTEGPPSRRNCRRGRGVRDDRLDRRLEHEVPAARRRHRRAHAGRRRLAAPLDARRRPARVRARHGRGADGGARIVLGGGRAVDHGADRAGPAQRHRVPQGHPLAVGPGPVPHLPRVRSGNRSVHRAAGRRRAHDTGPRAAERLEAAADPAAALVDESRADGRRQFEIADADPDVRARALDDHPAPARGPGRRQRLHLGRARQAVAGTGRPAEAEWRQRLAAAGDRHIRQRPVGVAADLPGSVDAGHRRVHRHRQPAARHPAHLADHDAGVTRPRDARGHEDATRRRRDGGRGSSAADRRRAHDDGPRA